MAKSSIHLQTSKGGTILHNARENYSNSVVFTDEKNELWNDSKTAFKLFRDELEIRTKAYTERTGQKLHKTTSTMISGVVNLEQKHTLKDLEKIKDYLEKEFDTKVIQMSVHRDEGKLINKENEDLKLVSGKDFFLNAKDNELYFDNKFTKKINMDEWKIEKNYHGHFEMLGLDTQGKTLRKKMNIVKLSKLQDFTAQSLRMERTLSNVIVNEKGKAQRKSTTNKKRLDTHEFKEQAKIINETKKESKLLKTTFDQLLATKQDLSAAQSEAKEYLKELGAKREDYAKLEQLNRDLKEQLKTKDLTIEEMQSKFNSLKYSLEEKFNELHKEKEHLQSVVKLKEVEILDLEPYKNLYFSQEHDLNSLQEQNKVLVEKVSILEEKINSSPNIEQYEHFKQQHEIRKKIIIEEAKQIPELEPEKTNLRKLVDYFKNTINEMKEKISNLFKRNEELEKENKSLKDELYEYKKEKLINEGKNNPTETIKKVLANAGLSDSSKSYLEELKAYRKEQEEQKELFQTAEEVRKLKEELEKTKVIERNRERTLGGR